jgi:hypothetical protein
MGEDWSKGEVEESIVWTGGGEGPVGAEEGLGEEVPVATVRGKDLGNDVLEAAEIFTDRFHAKKSSLRRSHKLWKAWYCKKATNLLRRRETWDGESEVCKRIRSAKERGTHPLRKSNPVKEEERESTAKMSEQERTVNHWSIGEKDLSNFLILRSSQWWPVCSRFEVTS